MKTIGSALDEHKGFGQGFDFLRIFLATAIIASHVAQLTGHQELVRTSGFWLLEYMLVPMFFALSGFLVAGSSMRLSPINFVLNRTARIVPALVVDIIFAALLIGPLVTTQPIGAYFQSSIFFSYFLNIIGWIHYALPGVFESNPLPEVNGALWTVPFEIGCYVVLTALMVTGAIKKPRLVPLLTCAVLIAWIPLRVKSSQMVGDDPSPMAILATNLFLFRGSLLWPSFLIGIVFYQLRNSVPFSKWIAVAIGIAAIFASVFANAEVAFANPTFCVIALPLLGYLTVTIGVSTMPRLPGFGTGDYSYGLYLYHVPFLQLLIHYFPQAWSGDAWWTLFFAGFPLALTAAVVSWHVFEHPVLKFRSSFVIKHRPESGVGGLLDAPPANRSPSALAPRTA